MNSAGIASRQAIIDAAIQLFAARGKDGVSLRDIADQSGLRLGSIYHQFPKKADLYNAAIFEASLYCQKKINDAVARSHGAANKFEALCRTLFASFVSGDPNFRLIDRAVQDKDHKDYPGIIRSIYSEMHSELAQIFSDTPEGEEDRLLEPDWVVSYVCSLAYGAAKLHDQHERFLAFGEPREFVDNLVRFAIRGAGLSIKIGSHTPG